MHLFIAFNLLAIFMDTYINEIYIAIETCTVSMDTCIMVHTLCSVNSKEGQKELFKKCRRHGTICGEGVEFNYITVFPKL